MRGAVMVGHVAVLGLDQNVVVLIDKDGAERMIAVAGGAAGDIERPAQKMFVEFGSAQIRNVHDRSCRSRIMQSGQLGQARSRSVRSVPRHVPADLGEVGLAGAGLVDELAVEHHHQAIR